MPGDFESEPPAKSAPNLKSLRKMGLPSRGWNVLNQISYRIWSHPQCESVLLEIDADEIPNEDVSKMWPAVHPLYDGAARLGGLPFHSALVRKDGFGYLLAGTGGIGKSTCCRRIPAPWEAVSDDEALIAKDGRGRPRVHAFPTWNAFSNGSIDRTWDVQKHLPLKAIFFLERATRDKARPLSQAEAAVRIFHSADQVCWRMFMLPGFERDQSAYRKLMFDNACELAKLIPCFVLGVRLRGRFWEEMDKAVAGLGRRTIQRP